MNTYKEAALHGPQTRLIGLDEPDIIPSRLKDGSLQATQVQNYSLWKAKTALLRSENVKPTAVDSNADRVVELMRETLSAFVPLDASNAWKDLNEIVYKAIHFDLEMNKSRALFKVHRWSMKDNQEKKFDGSLMESPTGVHAAEHGAPVELILAPLVTKTGNGDGDAFGSLSVISKWIVVCYENRKELQNRKEGQKT